MLEIYRWGANKFKKLVQKPARAKERTGEGIRIQTGTGDVRDVSSNKSQNQINHC